jgi:hypothetical protein
MVEDLVGVQIYFYTKMKVDVKTRDHPLGATNWTSELTLFCCSESPHGTCERFT